MTEDRYEEERRNLTYSIWYLGDDGQATWMSARKKGKNAEAALRGDIAHCDRVGLYLVCDPNSNPDSGWQGKNIFWVDENKKITQVRKIRRQLSGGNEGIDVEIEVIEI
jgi:hypothetical protein